MGYNPQASLPNPQESKTECERGCHITRRLSLIRQVNEAVSTAFGILLRRQSWLGEG